MSMSLHDFIQQQIEMIQGFDSSNNQNIQEVVRKTIKHYQLKSFEELEESSNGTLIYLYIHSMAEENILNRVVTLSTNMNSDMSVEAVYEGKVIRQY
ncbi:DUF6407 family protein [Bacillus pinisoli]|uniref:DUF6407 family protein n=1 Tax=Bacillus pinisoli TaxID=2901866 RepID=UPI001FF15401|nr:DUF6407 family protein [Bacillus pinisoli]